MPEQIIEGFRVSPQQRRLWRLQQGGQKLSYWTRALVRISGEIDLKALEKVIAKVVNRHESLRTTFDFLSGMTVPVQVISEKSHLSLKIINLSKLGEAERQERVEKLFAEVAQRVVAFDLLPLFHADLVMLSPYESVLILSVPALCADGRSLQNLVQEIGNSYALHSLNEPDSAAMQYADFAEWQNDLLESQEADTGKQHWKQNLDEAIDLKIPFE